MSSVTNRVPCNEQVEKFVSQKREAIIAKATKLLLEITKLQCRVAQQESTLKTLDTTIGENDSIIKEQNIRIHELLRQRAAQPNTSSTSSAAG